MMPLLVLTAFDVDPSLTTLRVFRKPFATERLLAEIDLLHGRALETRSPRGGGGGELLG